MAKYEQERDFVKSMLDLAGLTPDRLADPKVEFGEEAGVDVLCFFGERTIGVQVTEYNPDYGLPADCSSPKSAVPPSRAVEKKLAKDNPGGYGFSASGEYIRALAKSLKAKLEKSFSFVDEGWLLIVAQNPTWGITSSTFVAADHVSVDQMNAELHHLLAGKHYAKAFLFLATERVLYEWNPDDKWQLRKDARSVLDPARVEALRQKLKFSKS